MINEFKSPFNFIETNEGRGILQQDYCVYLDEKAL
jgi:hypothetical protein